MCQAARKRVGLGVFRFFTTEARFGRPVQTIPVLILRVFVSIALLWDVSQLISRIF